MTGHEPILAMRRKGRAPACVYVNDYPTPCHDLGTVSLAPTDVPERIDWRFVVGLLVILVGDDQKRVERIAKACKEYAKRVIASTVRIEHNTPGWYGYPKTEVIAIADTDGVMTWPK